MTREDELIHRIEQGDPDAVEELVKIYYPEILRYCLWHAPDRSLAEDAAQETFFKAVRYFNHYVHKGKFKAFLYQIAANTCVDMRRKRWLSDFSYEELALDFACAETGFEEIHSNLFLKQVVCRLPDDLREIVILRFGQDLTLKEIANIVGLPLRTVQSRLNSALKRLRKEFEKGGFYES
ncbi:RNA polymerase sigma factor [Faecalicatena sp. AGMB00832]|uniref:RNA polymerase sigma factor n=1 Tax=Faecalicatena faecalis TaxID=2726362 RepID=A0ABS6D6R7_9FIRM|nr:MULTISPECIES: RNA polymerase sigma factor [Faecalicatena]MBU3877201.1 RNA polymerase sigma factor [Faecalicatena faecalis]MCI6467270.1 RNA polymerase sigma factor [Faecalicatena sp.]MDY5620275.1 RNA polymerase sigma factor [Lachnospiraceae bacterium]